MSIPHLAEPKTGADLVQLSINTIRTLSIDAVEQAKSGHPGTPMALAPLVYTLWNRVMQFDPQDPIWPNRDRFVLSNGHASMLLWSVLHLTGTRAVNSEYERLGQPAVTLDDIRHFRQLDSKAPGHPEYGWVSGVETTTGPLGQGVATSVGMAIARKVACQPLQPARLRDLRLQDLRRVRRRLPDGGHFFGSGIAGRPPGARQPLLDLRQQPHHHRRQHQHHVHGRRRSAVPGVWLECPARRRCERHRSHRARARRSSGRPRAGRRSSFWTAISATAPRTSRAQPRRMASRSARKRSASQSATTDGRKTRSSWCPTASTSTSPRASARAARRPEREWIETLRAYRAAYPELAAEIDLMQRRELPDGWDRNLPVFPADPKGMAGREASGKVLNVLAQNIPWLLGGSADLGPSNKTLLRGRRRFPGRQPRRQEICTSASASTPWRPSSTDSRCRSSGRLARRFFVFSDYARPAMRLSALMELPAIFIFTHDAMGDGEDGPTHQPVEHLASLRAIPGLVTLRPGDANEVVEAYRYIMQLRHEPAVLALSRQPLPTLDRSEVRARVGRGARRLCARRRSGRKPEVILIASGSEVSLAVHAHEKLIAEGIRSRVVSMPSWDIFEQQTRKYRDSVLPPEVTARIAIEQASTFGWERYVGIGRPHHRHGDVRGVGAAQGTPEEVRLRAGQGSAVRQGIAGPVVSHERRQSGRPERERSQLRRAVRNWSELSAGGYPGSPAASTSASSRAALPAWNCCSSIDEDDGRPARVIPIDPVLNRTYHYWHVFVPGVQAGPDLRLSSSRTVRSCARSSVRSVQGPARSVRPRRGRSEELQPRRRSHAGRQRRDGDEERGGGSARLRLGRRCAAEAALLTHHHLRDACARLHRHPSSGVTEAKRGTYAGLIEKIPYLQQLGITAVELLPVFQFDAQDCPPGRVNYWGYAPVSFFAPHQAYSSRQDPLGPVDEFRDMVKALHRAGIEVILDVVFNHTAEGDHRGPTLCFRGLDNTTYYILEAGPLALRQLQRHREHAERQSSGCPADDRGQPSLLGRGNARGWLPVRSRLHPRARFVRSA